MVQRIKLRRGHTTEWDTINPRLAEGEPAVDLDSHGLKIGDGTLNWTDLPYVTGVSSGGGGTLIETADTFENYKIIVLSDGTVRAIPDVAEPPGIPLPTITTRLSSVLLEWPAAARASSYAILRDFVQIATTGYLAFRDRAVVVGAHYTYRLQSIDQYGQRSTYSNPLDAFIDPALNVPPEVSIRTWPEAMPTVGKAYVRINASDLNAQALALHLDVSVGTLEATDDPSVYLYTAP